jgi:hypothetical protein
MWHHRVHPGYHRAVAVPVGLLSARSVVVVEVGGHMGLTALPLFVRNVPLGSADA